MIESVYDVVLRLLVIVDQLPLFTRLCRIYLTGSPSGSDDVPQLIVAVLPPKILVVLERIYDGLVGGVL